MTFDGPWILLVLTEAVNKSNQKVKGVTQEEYDEVTRLGVELKETLHTAFLTGDPAGELAQKAADLHRQWLSFYWDSYSKEAHVGVTQMYVDDERFTPYYDEKQPGTAAYERSQSFQTGTPSKQRPQMSLVGSELAKDYYDEMDYRKRESIHAALQELSQEGIITVTWPKLKENIEVNKIYLNLEGLGKAYQLTGKMPKEYR